MLQLGGLLLDYQNYSLLHRALDASAMRQEAVSTNIANVNTPEYKAKRVDFEQQLRKAVSSGMDQTHDKHFGANDLSTVTPTIREREGTMIRDDGNNVDIDQEMAELSANTIYYNSLVTQLSAKYSMVRTALR